MSRPQNLEAHHLFDNAHEAYVVAPPSHDPTYYKVPVWIDRRTPEQIWDDAEYAELAEDERDLGCDG